MTPRDAFPALCVSIAEPTREAARHAAARAVSGGAMVELRVDCLEEPSARTVEGVGSILEGTACPTIVTWRRPRDGGRLDLADEDRLPLLAECARALGIMCDIELDLAAAVPGLGLDPSLLVLSHHDMARTPDLHWLFDAMTRTPAAVYKIATLARSVDDVEAHFDLLGRANREERPLVSLAMGGMGIPTRVLGPAYGAAFSFCASSDGRESAPGQLTLADMKDVYRAPELTGRSTVTGLVAARTDYSLSPRMHNAAYAALGLDGVYLPFEVDDLARFLRHVVAPSTRRMAFVVRGVSITNPFKTEVIERLDRLSPDAQRAGAVNTVVVEGDELVGHNTDVEGALRPLVRAIGPLAGLLVGVIGTGGAARALALGVTQAGARLRVYGRDEDRARALASQFGGTGTAIGALEGERPDVLVNATPVGTVGPQVGESPVPPEWLAGVGLVYELVYNPLETTLLGDARAAGCRTLGGLEMLAEQAALQFELWTGEPIDPETMLAATVVAPDSAG